MAEPPDVGARLADGRPAVDTIGDYVWACHLLGYHNPDLTLHSAQVRDWYGSEDGLDLRALEADRAALASVAAAADGARRLQEQQLDALSDAWRGRGADASREFLVRHAEASSAAESTVRNAVDVLAALREDLWRAVDEKVATAIEIDDRRQAERPQWQAATRTVASGAGDRAAASETVDQQVKPFVDNDIRSDWLTAMQKAMAAVSAAFDAATSTLTGEPSPTFEVPGDLGPTTVPTEPSTSGRVDGVAGTTPAGWSPPAPSAPMANPMTAPSFPAATPEPLAAPMPAAQAMPSAPAPPSALPSMPGMPSLGEMGGGMPGGTGGLAGLGTQLADAIGGLLNSTDSGLPEPQDNAVDDIEPAADPEEPPTDDGEDVEKDKEDETDAASVELAESDDGEQNAVDTCAEEEPVDAAPPPEPAPTPPPAPMPPPPIVEPPPDAEPLGAETPCEIAADELPQAGP
ncbi:MAG TPA: hypothetical protein VJR50_15040 [Mycobacterium sp.]|nr:hypothetical protein [Mycobacterium sp.]